MATLQDSDIADLIKSTRADEGVGRFNEIASRLTHYEVMSRMMKTDKQEFQAGRKVQGNLLVNHSFSAKQVGLHEVIEPTIDDLFEQFEVPWRHTNCNWSWERREGLMNRSAQQIFNMIDGRRVAAMISLFEHLETQFWTAPTDSDNALDWYGIPYWVVKATSDTAGFNGGNPTGFSDGAGSINSDTHTRWANWNAQYTDVTEDDLLRELRKACRRTDFKSPVDFEDYSNGGGQQRRIYMNEETIDAMESDMRTRNDNHSDLAQYYGATTFKRHPLRYVPKLNDDTQNPVYCLNFEWLALVFLSGDFLYEHDPEKSPNQPNTWVVHTDLTGNVLCTNRRMQAVINKA